MITKYRRLITFALVGIVNTFVDFAVFSLVLFISIANVLIAQMAAYIAGLTCSFFLNKYLTFQNTTKSTKQIVMFLVVNVLSMLFSVVAIYFFHMVIGVQEHIAKLFLVTPITMVLNYVGYKHIVFR